MGHGLALPQAYPENKGEKMNYLEIINKCLLELNYRQVNSFNELVKNDHKRIKTIINIVNREVCSAHKWNFLLRKAIVTIPPDTVEINNTINGRILCLTADDRKYEYSDNAEAFLTCGGIEHAYSQYSDKLLFPKSDEERTVQVFYYTKDCAKDINGNEKAEMTDATDSPIIPMPFCEQILTYGTCLRLKANPSYIRFSYWLSMYKEALANLRSTSSVDSCDAPFVRLFRQ